MEIDVYHPRYPAVEAPLIVKVQEAKLPDPKIYDDMQRWQAAYDDLYRQNPLACPNLAGHF